MRIPGSPAVTIPEQPGYGVVPEHVDPLCEAHVQVKRLLDDRLAEQPTVPWRNEAVTDVLGQREDDDEADDEHADVDRPAARM